jgi:hypothetical protein
MKKKLKLVFTPGSYRVYLLLFFLFLFAFSYGQTVTGVVTDGSKPIAGATIQVKGMTNATVTDNAGKFTLIAAGNAVLVISSVGFTTTEIALDGKTTLNISLATDTRSMTEVVVTALGIKKESRKLGYSTSTVKVDEITQNRTTNVMKSLEGKIAGLDIAPPTAGAGASTRIRLRGQAG